MTVLFSNSGKVRTNNTTEAKNCVTYQESTSIQQATWLWPQPFRTWSWTASWYWSFLSWLGVRCLLRRLGVCIQSCPRPQCNWKVKNNTSTFKEMYSVFWIWMNYLVVPVCTPLDFEVMITETPCSYLIFQPFEALVYGQLNSKPLDNLKNKHWFSHGVTSKILT